MYAARAPSSTSVRSRSAALGSASAEQACAGAAPRRAGSGGASCWEEAAVAPAPPPASAGTSAPGRAPPSARRLRTLPQAGSAPGRARQRQPNNAKTQNPTITARDASARRQQLAPDAAFVAPGARERDEVALAQRGAVLAAEEGRKALAARRMSESFRLRCGARGAVRPRMRARGQRDAATRRAAAPRAVTARGRRARLGVWRRRRRARPRPGREAAPQPALAAPRPGRAAAPRAHQAHALLRAAPLARKDNLAAQRSLAVLQRSVCDELRSDRAACGVSALRAAAQEAMLGAAGRAAARGGASGAGSGVRRARAVPQSGDRAQAPRAPRRRVAARAL
jgi:hypothetical protein